MKRSFTLMLALIFVAAWAFPALAAPAAYSGYPYFFIASVSKDSQVTITAYNFPPNDLFTVRMGTYGTAAIGGYVVDTVVTGGAGGLNKTTFTIPTAMAGTVRIAIRLESSASGFYAYNWFYNSSTGTTDPVVVPVTGYTGYPYFFIAAVTADDVVSITPYNFPPDDTFNVRLGAYGTLGVGGTIVESVTTDANGKLSDVEYDIPAVLAGSYRIAIRLESPTSGYYAYNWFFNNTTSGGPVVVPPPVTPGYIGYPYFFIAAVAKDSSVSISAYNFPPNNTFTVRMGAFGTYGISGTVVDTITTDASGVLSKVTYSIPASLAGNARIAIRMDSSNGIYYAYNWFYNNTAP